jgi:hypothetical protein
MGAMRGHGMLARSSLVPRVLKGVTRAETETKPRTYVTASRTTSSAVVDLEGDVKTAGGVRRSIRSRHRHALTAVVDFEGTWWAGWPAQRSLSAIDMYGY